MEIVLEEQVRVQEQDFGLGLGTACERGIRDCILSGMG